MSAVIVDLGCANLASMRFALDRLGVLYRITNDAAVIAAAERVILPGVGSARYAADRIDALNLRDTLSRLEQPLLGVCLGMQLLYETSVEGEARGLGRRKGRVKRLAVPAGAPWPHMGWSKLRMAGRDNRLLNGVDDGAYVYFVHGFYCPVGDETAALADYGSAFSAAVESENNYGCQFHPERSGADGARVLKNFLEAPC